jgi:hypothetical protein
MIYLQPSSSNTFAYMPSGSIWSAGTRLYRYTFSGSFSKQGQIVDLNGSYNGTWVSSSISLPSQLALNGGTYDFIVNDILETTPLVWGTTTEIYGLSTQIWSIATISGESGNTIYQGRAWVDRQYTTASYLSSNENAAYVVYNG